MICILWPSTCWYACAQRREAFGCIQHCHHWHNLSILFYLLRSPAHAKICSVMLRDQILAFGGLQAEERKVGSCCVCGTLIMQCGMQPIFPMGNVLAQNTFSSCLLLPSFYITCKKKIIKCISDEMFWLYIV